MKITTFSLFMFISSLAIVWYSKITSNLLVLLREKEFIEDKYKTTTKKAINKKYATKRISNHDKSGIYP